MNKSHLIFLWLFILILLSQNNAFAVSFLKNINLTWQTEGISGSSYQLYYSNESSMATATLHDKCDLPVEVSQNNFTMSCYDIPLDSYPIYIQVIWEDTITGEIINSNIQRIDNWHDNPAPSLTYIKQLP